jgi:hypothetical protein
MNFRSLIQYLESACHWDRCMYFHKTLNLFSIFSDIVYRSTSNTILFGLINKFLTFVKFLNYFRFST